MSVVVVSYHVERLLFFGDGPRTGALCEPAQGAGVQDRMVLMKMREKSKNPAADNRAFAARWHMPLVRGVGRARSPAEWSKRR